MTFVSPISNLELSSKKFVLTLFIVRQLTIKCEQTLVEIKVTHTRGTLGEGTGKEGL